MNRPIRRIALAFMVLFLALLVNVNYVQVIQAPELNEASNPVNKRVILDEYARERGSIVVGEGTKVAYSVKTKDPDDELKYVRKYAQTDLYAHLTGYYSYIYGASQLESDQNAFLSGTDDSLFVRRMIDLLTEKKPRGGDVQLTIDPAAQRAAYEALGDKQGSVVAIEPDTGRVLAMLSKPSYNPNPLASHDLETEERAWKRLINAEDKRADNRATQHRYPPGSTFKLVTAAAALETGDYDPDTVIPAPPTLDLPLTTHELPNWQGGQCVPGKNDVTLTEALETSCNTAFGGLGLEIGENKLREQAEKFGFNEDFSNLFRDGLTGSSSQFPEELDEPQTALSSIGQFDVQSTPLQMAMVTAAIANGGDVMRPYVVDKVIGPDLDTEKFDPDLYGRATSSSTAADLTQMMVDTVENGTAEPGALRYTQVAGKTGTAQTCDACNPYAWFTSFAPADNPEVAVAVVIEKADVARDEISGGQLAAPVARAVMDAVIDK